MCSLVLVLSWYHLNAVSEVNETRQIYTDGVSARYFQLPRLSLNLSLLCIFYKHTAFHTESLKVLKSRYAKEKKDFLGRRDFSKNSSCILQVLLPLS